MPALALARALQVVEGKICHMRIAVNRFNSHRAIGLQT